MLIINIIYYIVLIVIVNFFVTKKLQTYHVAEVPAVAGGGGGGGGGQAESPHSGARQLDRSELHRRQDVRPGTYYTYLPTYLPTGRYPYLPTLPYLSAVQN